MVLTDQQITALAKIIVCIAIFLAVCYYEKCLKKGKKNKGV